MTCNYSLDGLIERRCPECGTAFDPADAETFDTTRAAARRRRHNIIIAAIVLIGMAVMIALTLKGF